MGVTIDNIRDGNGADFPKPGDNIEMHYRGCLYDEKATDKMGSQFDSSYDRGAPLPSPIGVGRLIKVIDTGWDEAVPQMSLGQKARLTITPDYGYGARGFPPVIPGNATLVFEVELMSINGKRL
ncbi:peptidyl-prolyl cis-trans isomerase [Penicillium chermesinum]|uniref:peptidylprolyl isomerase n=1 Tax=Penicillium chermesinum TaxID=63820 RepID=A0A9W9NSN5_9EURO|nr:peptidyl-prolyl cis-trans isomerase [Penicillium chermesinum]KAJ5225451.1 peptidyl-prolyl cis-trans isomerase [Penicillium chermesinum]KAJ6161321.1 peptidyl-prolyl cis-trans isomerase [Penicillium chermesinum]